MKKCKNCGINDAIKYSKYTDGNFCSKECARGFSTKLNRLEINIKLSKKLKGCASNKPEYSNEKWLEIKNKRDVTYHNIIMNAEYSTLKDSRLRKRIILEQNNKCNRCHLDKWLSEQIVLELEHIDGDHLNNNRDNLEALCPNCHSLTPTWRGKNKHDNRNKITDEYLFEILYQNNFNMRQSLILVGLSPRGGNYKRCHRLKNEYLKNVTKV